MGDTPSKAPTKAPLQCSDGGSFYVSSKVAPKTCEWLASSTSNQKNCAKWFNWGKYDGKTYGAPGFICKATCTKCDPCYQHNKAKFYFKKKKGKVVLKNCSWLEKNKKKNKICTDRKTDGTHLNHLFPFSFSVSTFSPSSSS